MPKANAMEKGMFVLLHNEPYRVVEREFVKPGKGAAFVRFKLKNCRNGSVLRETLDSEASVEEADISRLAAQYLYNDGSDYHFMDAETYEQFAIPIQSFQERGRYMLEGESYELIRWDERTIDIDIPLKIAFEVLDAPHAIKGNSVAGSTKIARIQNDIEVKVPLFIKTGDRILVNTTSGEYVERAGN